jgi:hypothetical protein
LSSGGGSGLCICKEMAWPVLNTFSRIKSHLKNQQPTNEYN